MADWLIDSSEEEEDANRNSTDTSAGEADALGGQNFRAFANRMRSVGFREAAGAIAENLSQRSFNEGFFEASKISYGKSKGEGRAHAIEALCAKIEKDGKFSLSSFQKFLSQPPSDRKHGDDSSS